MALVDGLSEQCAAIVGAANVLRDPASIEPFRFDFWRQYSGSTALVVRPRSTDEVSRVVTLCAAHKVPIVPQSGNTGLVKGGIPDESGRAIVLSTQKLERIRSLEADHIVAEAGVILADIQAAAKAQGRLFPLSLGAEGSCRVGGNIGTNAGGVNVLRYGMTRDLVLGLEVVLADGRVWNGLRALRKDNTGYDLKQLFIGSEGTLGIVTAASLRLVPRPRENVTLWLGIDSPATSVQLLALFQEEVGELISSFELVTSFGVEAACTHLPGVRRPLASPQPWHLLIELGWTFESGLEARAQTVLERAIEKDLVLDGTIAQNETQRAMMWRIREGQSEATREIGFILRSDVTVPIGRVPELIERMTSWTARTAPDVTLLSFGHVGDGNLHLNFITPPDQVERLHGLLLGRLYEEVTALNGSISAEHGIGRLKSDALAASKPNLEIDLMRKIKAALDPDDILNPGVIFGERRS